MKLFISFKHTVNGEWDSPQLRAVLFIVLFFVAAFNTAVQLYRYKKNTPNPVVATFLFMGTPILELVGFAVRLSSVLHPFNLWLYLANMVILTLGPLYLTAINWFVFSALVVHVGPRYSVLKPWVFATQACILLVSCIHLSARGAALAYNYSKDHSYRKDGSAIMLSGFGLILAIWIIYAILFAIFVSRYFGEHSVREGSRIRAICLALFANIVVITIRTVYRIVESSLLTFKGKELNELWLCLGDAAPIAIGVMAFAFVHPYELPYSSIFKGAFKRGGGCRTSTEGQSEVPCDSA